MEIGEKRSFETNHKSLKWNTKQRQIKDGPSFFPSPAGVQQDVPALAGVRLLQILSWRGTPELKSSPTKYF